MKQVKCAYKFGTSCIDAKLRTSHVIFDSGNTWHRSYFKKERNLKFLIRTEYFGASN